MVGATIRYFCPAEYTLSQILKVTLKLTITLTLNLDFFFRFRFRVLVSFRFCLSDVLRWLSFLFVPVVV